MESVRLHRCHHCANADCPNGMYQKRGVREGGCEHYIFLDPLLRLPRYHGKRRIRKLTSVKLESENIDFIHNVILPSEPKRFRGYFTRGVHACIDQKLKDFGDEVPIVPPVEREGAYCRIEVKISLMPETMDAVDAIKAHWKGSAHRTSRSQIINWFIELCKEQVMEGVSQNGQ